LWFARFSRWPQRVLMGRRGNSVACSDASGDLGQCQSKRRLLPAIAVLVLSGAPRLTGGAGGITDDEFLLVSDGKWHRAQRKRIAWETSCYYTYKTELPFGCQYSSSRTQAWRQDPARKEQREVLVALYYQTGGAQGLWRADENWGEDTDPCWDQWYGVTCDEHGHIISLELTDNGLVGTLPSNLGRLTSLLKLDLSTTAPEYHAHPNVYRNRLSGPLPSLVDAARIEEIEISGNEIDALPWDLWQNAETLRSLSASHNKLKDLPQYLLRFTKLHTLELGHNEIDDEFPTDFGSLINMRFLQLEYNLLQGQVTDKIIGMRLNRVMDLSHNPGLSGVLPEGLIIEWKEQEYISILNTTISGYLSSLCLDVPHCWKFMYDTHKDLTWATANDVPDIVNYTMELALSGR